MTAPSTVRVGLVFPELLGTYGDRGNAIVLVERCRRRGIDAEIVEVAAGSPIPDSLDVYLFGGGEDDPQVMAAAGMRSSSDAIERARGSGAVILAVCAGFQLLGHTYEARDGERLEGLGLVDMETAAGPTRLIGEVVVEPDPSLGLPILTGFENHGGRTRLGAEERPLGRVVSGGGNGVDGVDGVLRDRVVGTYLHGPVLPRNPRLADLLLGWVVGSDLAPLDDHLIDELRTERLEAAGATGWRARLRDLRLNRG
ncbi:MAG: type 1 glutamine amidotransferase [Acidimicrobiia bacterium]